MTSFTPLPQGALPPDNVFAQAPPGCDLLVVPDILQAYVTTTGSVESSFFLPGSPPIVGLPFSTSSCRSKSTRSATSRRSRQRPRCC